MEVLAIEEDKKKLWNIKRCGIMEELELLSGNKEYEEKVKNLIMKYEGFIEKEIRMANNYVREIEETPINVFKQTLPERHWILNEKNYGATIEKVNKNLQRSAEKYFKRKRAKMKKQIRFDKGDLVIVKALRVANRKENKCAKLQLPYEGPYEIYNKQGVNSYILKEIHNDKIRGIFNINQIYKYYVEN